MVFLQTYRSVRLRACVGIWERRTEGTQDLAWPCSRLENCQNPGLKACSTYRTIHYSVPIDLL